MSVGRFHHSMIAWHDSIYVIGGLTGNNTDSTAVVERAVVSGDGKLGAWAKDTPLPDRRSHHGLALYEDALYVTAGLRGNPAGAHDDLKDVIRAPIMPDGSLGPWTTVGEPAERARHPLELRPPRLPLRRRRRRGLQQHRPRAARADRRRRDARRVGGHAPDPEEARACAPYAGPRRVRLLGGWGGEPRLDSGRLRRHVRVGLAAPAVARDSNGEPGRCGCVKSSRSPKTASRTLSMSCTFAFALAACTAPRGERDGSAPITAESPVDPSPVSAVRPEAAIAPTPCCPEALDLPLPEPSPALPGSHPARRPALHAAFQ